MARDEASRDGGRASPLWVDDARVDVVCDIERFEMPLTTLFPTADGDALQPHRHWLEPRYLRGDVIGLAIQSMVLRMAGRVILVDTCVGEHKPRPRHPAWHERAATDYVGRLSELGLSVDDVDYVLCTHLHADHVGWNTRLVGDRWAPTFPRARYLVGRAELAYWEARLLTEPGELVNHGSYADSVLPIVQAGKVDLVDAGDALLDGLSVRGLAGHTPGQIGLDLRRPNGRALFVGDAIHHPVQLIKPEWSTGLCADPHAAAETRQGFLAQAADDGAWLVPAHFIGSAGVQIKRSGSGYLPISLGT